MRLLAAVLFALAFGSSACVSSVVNDSPEEETLTMRAGPKPPPPVYEAPTLPSVNAGTTEFFTGAEARSIARANFDNPRSLVAYAYWDPYKNNPNATANASMFTTPAGAEIQVLGRIKVGFQGTIIETNFTISWGQLIAIPVSAEQVEITARLMNPVVADPQPTFLAFNDPPLFALAAGDKLPNASPQNPGGFVAISGGVTEGSALRGSTRPIDRQLRVSLGLGAGLQLQSPMAYGARRVTVLGDPAYKMTIVDAAGAPNVTMPINVTYDLTHNTQFVAVRNPTVGALAEYIVVWELGL